jgi:hypothetical protein
MKTRGVLNTKTSDHGPPPHGGSAVMYPRATLPLAPTHRIWDTFGIRGLAPVARPR